MSLIFWLDNQPDKIQKTIDEIIFFNHTVRIFKTEEDCIKELERNNLPDLLIQDLHRKSSTAQILGGKKRSDERNQWTSGWRFYEEVLKPYFPQIPVIIYSFDAKDYWNVRKADDYNLKIVSKNRREGNISIIISDFLDAQSNILQSKLIIPSIVITDFEKVNAALIKHLSKKPADLHKVSWKTFESLIGRLLEELGYEVEHTKLTRDDGVDLWAIKKDALSDILYAIDAKKYSPEKVLGPSFVRAIHGVADMKNANVGMIVTTAQFGPSALSLAEQFRYKISLKDFNGVIDWIKQVEGKQ